MRNLKLDGIGPVKLAPANTALRITPPITVPPTTVHPELISPPEVNPKSKRYAWVYKFAIAAILLALMVGMLWYFSISTSSVFSGQNSVFTSSLSKPQQSAPDDNQVQTLLDDFVAKYGVNSGIVVIDLKTRSVDSVNSDQIFTAASLYKLFVAESVYRGVQNGTIRPGQSVRGTGMNVSQCLNYMITVSDNTCGEALGNLVGWNRQNQRLHELGFTKTNLNAYSAQQTSAGDVALFFQRLYEGNLLSPSNTESFTNLLQAQKINNRLPAGLPKDTVIAHKTGDYNSLVHDAGIVYSPEGDYVVSVLTGPWNKPDTAVPAIKELSASIYNVRSNK